MKLPKAPTQLKFYALIILMGAGDLGFIRLFAKLYSQGSATQVLLYIVSTLLLVFVVREVAAEGK